MTSTPRSANLRYMRERGSDIALTMVRRRQVHIAVAAPSMPWSFAAVMAVAAAVAVLAGVVLGILAAIDLWVGSDRWTQTVQAHGRLQLFGFAAPFIVALALEFLPRLQQAPAFSRSVRFGLPVLLIFGFFLAGVGQVWYSRLEVLTIPGGLLIGIGALAFCAVSVRLPAPRPLRLDPQPLFLRAAAAWLAIAAVLAIWGYLRITSGVTPIDLSHAAIETFLRGFVLLTIVGVGLRAFPGHLGLEPMPARRQQVLLVGFNLALIAWLGAQGLGPLAELDWLARTADAAFAVTIVLASHWLGIAGALRSARSGPRYQVLLPVAWLGIVVYALLLLASALLPWGNRLDLYEVGAIRHQFLLGFMLPLMVAMAHIVLARFGTGRIQFENLLTAAFVLLLVAWPLRVVPALFDFPTSDVGRTLLGVAGLLVMVALALTATASARTAYLMRRVHR